MTTILDFINRSDDFKSLIRALTTLCNKFFQKSRSYRYIAWAPRLQSNLELLNNVQNQVLIKNMKNQKVLLIQNYSQNYSSNLCFIKQRFKIEQIALEHSARTYSNTYIARLCGDGGGKYLVSNKQKANLNEQTSVVCGLHGSR